MLITNDRNTMIAFASGRVARAEPFSGLIATTNHQSIGDAIEDILLVAECMTAEEIQDRAVVYLPYRD